MTKIFNIEGMTCSHCEHTIDNALKKEPGIIKAATYLKEKSAIVEFNNAVISESRIKKLIESEGYKVTGITDHDQAWESKKRTKEFYQISGTAIILLGAYFLIDRTIGFNFIPQVKSTMGFGMVFVIGLLTSIHCVAMCGGINISQNVNGKKALNGFLYNGGRVVSYTIMGGIVGALGSVFNFSPAIKSMIALAAGAMMVIVGLKMMGIFTFLKNINLPFHNLLAKIAPKRKLSVLPVKSHAFGPLIVGLLSGLMPCAPLQAMELYALGTGSALSGALSLAFFSLGTVPLMFGLSTIASLFSRKFSSSLMRVSAVIVIFLGLIMVNRGLSYSGQGIAILQKPANIAVLKDGHQEVIMNVQPGSFEPIVVQKGIPVRWTIRADAKDLNGCNNGINAPEFGIQTKLRAGDNLVEFTPGQSGTFGYSCWMGMINSKIIVVDDVTKADSSSITNNNNNLSQNNGGGCCSRRSEPAAFYSKRYLYTQNNFQQYPGSNNKCRSEWLFSFNNRAAERIKIQNSFQYTES